MKQSFARQWTSDNEEQCAPRKMGNQWGEPYGCHRLLLKKSPRALEWEMEPGWMPAVSPGTRRQRWESREAHFQSAGVRSGRMHEQRLAQREDPGGLCRRSPACSAQWWLAPAGGKTPRPQEKNHLKEQPWGSHTDRAWEVACCPSKNRKGCNSRGIKWGAQKGFPSAVGKS